MISVLIPWRSDDEDRIRAWHYNRLRWQNLPVQLCVADDGRTEGPFSVARAVNRARRQATSGILAIFGADHIPPDLGRLAWIEDRLAERPWSAVYAGTRVIGRNDTDRVLRGLPPGLFAETRGHLIAMCEGIIAVRASVWDDLGGMDERFVGWGAEDTAFKVALRALYPDGGAGEGETWALWHPDRHGTTELTAANIARCTEYETAAREGRMRDYLAEVKRDGSRDNS